MYLIFLRLRVCVCAHAWTIVDISMCIEYRCTFEWMCIYVCVCTCVHKRLYTHMYSETRKTLVLVCRITLQFPPCSALNLFFWVPYQIHPNTIYNQYTPFSYQQPHPISISHQSARGAACSGSVVLQASPGGNGSGDNPQVGSYVLCGAIQPFTMLSTHDSWDACPVLRLAI